MVSVSIIARYAYGYAIIFQWRDGRAAEGAGLENQYGGNSIVGSNPTLSAMMVGHI